MRNIILTAREKVKLLNDVLMHKNNNEPCDFIDPTWKERDYFIELEKKEIISTEYGTNPFMSKELTVTVLDINALNNELSIQNSLFETERNATIKLFFGLGGYGCNILRQIIMSNHKENTRYYFLHDEHYMLKDMKDLLSKSDEIDNAYFWNLHVSRNELEMLYNKYKKEDISQNYFTNNTDLLISQICNGINYGYHINRPISRMEYDNFILTNHLDFEAKLSMLNGHKGEIIIKIISSLFGGFGSSGILPIVIEIKNCLMNLGIDDDMISITVIGIAPEINMRSLHRSTIEYEYSKAISYAVAYELDAFSNISSLSFQPNFIGYEDLRNKTKSFINNLIFLDYTLNSQEDFLISVSDFISKDDLSLYSFADENLISVDILSRADYRSSYFSSNEQLHIDARWEKQRMEKSSTKICNTIFLSYNTNESDLADIIDKAFSFEPSIRISRFTRDVEYRGSFKDFMKRVKKHDFVIMLISDCFLKSQACMFEVSELLTDDNFKKKLLFIVVSDKDCKYLKQPSKKTIGAKIYSATSRNEYIVYWEARYDEVKESIDSIKSESAKIEPTKQLREIRRIIDHDLSPFLDYLCDARGQSFDEVCNSGFSSLFNVIEKRTSN